MHDVKSYQIRCKSHYLKLLTRKRLHGKSVKVIRKELLIKGATIRFCYLSRHFVLLYNNNNNNTQIYLTSAIIQIKVKTPKLIAEALAKESSSGNVKYNLRSEQLSTNLSILSPFFYVSCTVLLIAFDNWIN